MKRGLKSEGRHTDEAEARSEGTFPDEEGTEIAARLELEFLQLGEGTFPDEEGTEMDAPGKQAASRRP